MFRHVPVKIMDGVADVSLRAGGLAVKTDGSLYAWGDLRGGLIGNGKNDEYLVQATPIKIMDDVKLPNGAVYSTPQASSQTQANPYIIANPTAGDVLVNGENVAFDACNIGGNNYFKLRDLAYVLNGTEKQFEVGYDEATKAIALTGGEAYTPVGGELEGKGAETKTPVPTTSKITLDSQAVNFTAYNIGGNNYFKLRDIGEALDFGVAWDGAKNTVVIDTGRNYTP
jgi:hypothetical protein